MAARDRAGAVLWLLCAQFFVAEQVVSRAWRVPYSFAQNYVSDLGAVGCGVHNGLLVCSPLHAWMNASFVLQGMLILGGTVLLWRARRGHAVGFGLLAVSGAGVLVVGLAPEDVYGKAHVLGAVLHFVGGGLGMVVLGVTMTNWRRWISVVAGVTVIAATALTGLHGALGWPAGSVERVAAYGIPIWLMGMGAWLLRREPTLTL